MEKFALVSVYDKTGLEPFVRSLIEAGYQILSTGGTYTFLQSLGIEVISIVDYTNSPEILDGRVKTLHPKVHGGILARRDLAQDLEELNLVGGGLIDFVVVNLYPFIEKVREVELKRDPKHPSLIEYIDIGGPTMLRAAAKNSASVAAVSDPADYPRIMAELSQGGSVAAETRAMLAGKVFLTMASYDGAVARYFSLGERLLAEDGSRKLCAPVETFVLKREQELRYGENPHQSAAIYREYSRVSQNDFWQQLQGKEISYNNLLDLHAALDLFLEINTAFPTQESAVIIKHLNPCGVAVRATNLEAFREARHCDSISAFGGIVAVSGLIDGPLAETILEGFVEIVVGESYSAEALEKFTKKKNIRVIQCDLVRLRAEYNVTRPLVRNAFADFLVQSSDSSINPVKSGKMVTERRPNASELDDLELAWRVCKHVKSNAIVIVKDRKAVGIGAGQMSRVDSARIAIERARNHAHDISGAAAASDAFLPFPDSLELLAEASIGSLVQPGGSIKDEEVIGVANRLGVAMVLTGDRHFRH